MQEQFQILNLSQNLTLAPGLAKLYCEIFLEPPYNEVFDQSSIENKVISYVRNGIRKSIYTLTLSSTTNDVVGFLFAEFDPPEKMEIMDKLNLKGVLSRSHLY